MEKIVFYPFINHPCLLNMRQTPFVFIYNDEFIYLKGWLSENKITNQKQLTVDEMKTLDFPFKYISIQTLLTLDFLKDYDNSKLPIHINNKLVLTDSFLEKLYAFYRIHKLLPFGNDNIKEIENELIELLGETKSNLNNLTFFPSISVSLYDNIDDVQGVKDFIYAIITKPIFLDSLNFCKTLCFKSRQDSFTQYYFGVSNYNIVWGTCVKNHNSLEYLEKMKNDMTLEFFQKIKQQIKLKQCIIKVENNTIIQIYSDLIELPLKVDCMRSLYVHLHEDKQINIYY